MDSTSLDLLQQQIDDLQSRLVHQEDLLQSLNDVIVAQDALIGRLQQQYQQIKHRLDERTHGTELHAGNKPPHY